MARVSPTKHKILDVALRLFNEHGYANVTTARIAAEAGISEGNLWYHYRTKRDLVLELWEKLQELVRRRMAMPTSVETVLDDFIALNRFTYSDMWAYRFLFRDRIDVFFADPDVEGDLQDIYALGFAQFERFTHAMIEAGHFRTSDVDARALSTNVWMVVRYWLDFLAETQGITHVEPAHVAQGVAQQLSLGGGAFPPGGPRAGAARGPPRSPRGGGRRRGGASRCADDFEETTTWPD